MRRKSVITSLLAIVALGIVGAYFYLKPSLSLDKTSATLVKVQAVTLHNMPRVAITMGNIIAPNSLDIEAQEAGMVKSILFQNGQQVSANEVLVQLDDTVERATLIKIKAQLSQSEAQYQRYKQLLAAHEVSQAAYDVVNSQYLQDQASLQQAQYNEDQTHIRAPFAGTVGETTLAPGSLLAVGDKVVSLVDLNHLELAYTLPQNYLGQAALGQTVHFSVDPYPGEAFQGQVDYISPTVDPRTGSFNLRAKVDNSQQRLHPGLIAQIRQTLNPNDQVLAVPVISLIPDVAGFTVYTVVDDKVQSIAVTVGQRSGQWAEVTKGLKAGDKVILAGQEKVKPGMRVLVAS